MADTLGHHDRGIIRNLSESERKDIFGRIERSLCLSADDDVGIVANPPAKDEVLHLLRRDMRKMTLADRLKFRVLRSVSPKTDETVFTSMKLAEVKERLEAFPDGLINPSSDAVGPLLSEHVTDLEVGTQWMRRKIGRIWTDRAVVQEVVEKISAQLLCSGREIVEDFFDRQDLVGIFLAHSSPHGRRDELLTQMQAYAQALPQPVVAEIATIVLPLYLLRPLAVFPFREFRRVLPEIGGRHGGDWQTPIRSLLPFLQELYYIEFCLDQLQKKHTGGHQLTLLWQVVSAVADGLAMPESEREPEGTSDTGEAEQVHRSESRSFIDYLAETIDAVQRFRSRVPITDIIRHQTRNPYYRFLVYFPAPDIRQFLTDNLRLAVLSSVDDRFASLRRETIDQLRRDLSIADRPGLEYLPQAELIVRSLALPGFRDKEALEDIHRFFDVWVKERVFPYLRVLNRAGSMRFRDVQSRLTVAVNGLEDVDDRIRQFDRLLSPDSDDGKTIARLRFAGDSDAQQSRTFRVLVNQKNEDTQLMVDRFVEHLNGLRSAFHELLIVKTESLEERFRIFAPNAESGMAAALGAVIDAISGCEKLIKNHRSFWEDQNQ